MFRYVIILVLLVLTVAECWAVQPYEPVQPDPFLEPWRWQFFDELNGQGLQCLAEDSSGNMWFGIDEGVVRYDGINWTTYRPEDGLHGAPVITLYADRDSDVFAGTAQGISRFTMVFQIGCYLRRPAWRPAQIRRPDLDSLCPSGSSWTCLRYGPDARRATLVYRFPFPVF